VVLLMVWSIVTAVRRGSYGQTLVIPSVLDLHLSLTSLGWLQGTVIPSIGVCALFIAFGHSIIAIPAEESISQANEVGRSIPLVKLTGLAIVNLINGLLFPGLVPFLFVSLVPEMIRAYYIDVPLAGLMHFMVGPEHVRLLFTIIVSVLGA